MAADSQPGSGPSPGAGAGAAPPAGRGSTQHWPVVSRRLRLGSRPRDELPGLLLLWCLWLLGSWLIIRYDGGSSLAQLIGLGAYAGPDVTTVDLRWMMVAAVAGLTGLWPVVRLTQGPAHRAGLNTVIQPLVDWVGLMLIWQAVLWSVYVMLPWPIGQVVWLAVAMTAWGLLVGLVIGLGRVAATAPARAGAMLGCLVLLLAEPAIRALWFSVFETPWNAPTQLSPLRMFWALTAPPGYLVLDPWRSHAVALLIAGVLGWTGLLMLLPWRRRAAVRAKR